MARGRPCSAIGTLYAYFQNKDDLYRALMLDLSHRFESGLHEALETPGSEMEKIDRFLDSKSELFEANVKVVRLYIAETRGASFNLKAGLDQEMRDSYERTLGELAAVFAAGIVRGDFREEDPYMLALALDNLTNTAFLTSMRSEARGDSQKNMVTMKRIFFDRVHKA